MIDYAANRQDLSLSIGRGAAALRVNSGSSELVRDFAARLLGGELPVHNIFAAPIRQNEDRLAAAHLVFGAFKSIDNVVEQALLPHIDFVSSRLHRDDLIRASPQLVRHPPIHLDLSHRSHRFDADEIYGCAAPNDVDGGLPGAGRIVGENDSRKSSDKGASANAKHVIPQFSDGAVAPHSEMRQARRRCPPNSGAVGCRKATPLGPMSKFESRTIVGREGSVG